MIARNDITGLILAGGRGSRMGGVDKGLQTFHGTPMVQHVLQRLAPQTSAVLINANRNVDRYAMFGVPVVADALPDFAGPLAGMLAGLDQCTPEEFQRLQNLNASYNQKFGFPFILAVRGYDRHGIIDAFARRLDNAPDVELQTCINQIHRIAQFRLNDLVSA